MKNYKNKDKSPEKFYKRKLNSLQHNMKNKLSHSIKIWSRKLLLIMISMNPKFAATINKSFKP
jgi:hypothetical protein